MFIVTIITWASPPTCGLRAAIVEITRRATFASTRVEKQDKSEREVSERILPCKTLLSVEKKARSPTTESKLNLIQPA